MAETTATPPATPPAAADGAARVVLFGRSRSGKSALLAALGEAARAGGGELHGEPAFPTEGAPAMGSVAPGGEAGPIVAYRAVYRPAAGEPLETVFLDCEGLAASELLARVEDLEEDSPELPLAREVLDADALVLTVDASAPPEELNADFAAFKGFLRTLEERRGQDAAVGGLPAYLVLTHADLLARPLDSPTEWVEQLEGRKREVDDAFQAYLTGEAPNGGVDARRDEPDDAPEEEGEDVEPEEDEGRETGFGWVDVRVWATALKRPVLRGLDAATEQGPFGVSELFRQALAGAADFRHSEERSRLRLRRLVATSLLLVALLVGVTAFQIVTLGQGPPRELVARIESYRFRDGATPEQYLRGTVAELRDRRRVLLEIRDDARFEALPDEPRTFVTARLAELSAYIDYYERLQASRSPFEEWAVADLELLRGRLAAGNLALPRPTWDKAPAGLLRGDRLLATEALLRGAEKLTDWYERESAAAEALWTFSNDPPSEGVVPWAKWADKVQKLLVNRSPPEAAGDPLPGPSDGLTYADVMRLFEVKDARIGWELERDRLADLLNVVAALGLARDVPGRAPALVIPGDVKLEDMKDRLAAFRKAYPASAKGLGTRLPEAVERPIALAARDQYNRLLAPARAEVLRRLLAAEKGDKDTPARWEAVRAWLQSKDERLDAFNELALVLLRLIEARPEAPGPALARFLGEKTFPLTLETVVVEVRRFSGIEPEKGTALKLTLTADGKTTEVELTPLGGGRDDPGRRVTTYTYQVKKRTLVHTPGAKLTLELPLARQKDAPRQRLVWVDQRSPRYQFERLHNPPRRKADGAAPEARVIEDVRLVFRPADGVPRVPDLVPEVTLKE